MLGEQSTSQGFKIKNSEHCPTATEVKFCLLLLRCLPVEPFSVGPEFVFLCRLPSQLSQQSDAPWDAAVAKQQVSDYRAALLIWRSHSWVDGMELKLRLILASRQVTLDDAASSGYLVRFTHFL